MVVDFDFTFTTFLHTSTVTTSNNNGNITLAVLGDLCEYARARNKNFSWDLVKMRQGLAHVYKECSVTVFGKPALKSCVLLFGDSVHR